MASGPSRSPSASLSLPWIDEIVFLGEEPPLPPPLPCVLHHYLLTQQHMTSLQPLRAMC